MNLSEEKVYEALGIDVKEPEVVEPAAAGTAEKSEDSDTQGVGADGNPPDDGDTDDDDEGDEDVGDDPCVVPPQTPEQRAENAAKRRREEQEAAISAAVQKAVADEREKTGRELESFFAGAKLTNTLTGEPINNMSEFNKWREAFETAKFQSDLEEGKLTPEGLDRAIAQNPAIRQLQEKLREKTPASAEAPSLPKEGRDVGDDALGVPPSVFQARVDAELAEINKLDPAIKTVEDLMRQPNAREFYEHVKRGNSFIDAFRLTNYERLQATAATAARQQAVSNARSKDHLTATGSGRGSGAISVPSDELALFRELNPKATDAEIQAYYNKLKQ